MERHRIAGLHPTMNVRHDPAKRELHDQKGHDQPVKYLGGRSIVWLFGHDVPCFRLPCVASSCEARLPSGRSVFRFAEVTIVARNLRPSWISSLPTVRRPISLMWLNRFWSESRGLFGNSNCGFRDSAADTR